MYSHFKGNKSFGLKGFCKKNIILIFSVLLFLNMQKTVAQPLFETTTFPVAASNPIVNWEDPGVTNNTEWVNAAWRQAWWVWGDATIYTESLENWLATSSIGNTSPYPGVTLFALDAASDLRTWELCDYASCEIVYNGTRVIIWIFGNDNYPDGADSWWIGASGIGRPFINDIAGFLVRLNNNLFSDRQFFAGIDVEPGDPTFNFSDWYGVFGHYSFNNSPFANGLPNSRNWNHEVYELCIRKLGSPWMYCAGNIWFRWCKPRGSQTPGWTPDIPINGPQKDLAAHVGLMMPTVTVGEGYRYVTHSDTVELKFHCCNLSDSSKMYNYVISSSLGATYWPPTGYFSLIAHSDTLLSVFVLNAAIIGQLDTITMTLNSGSPAYTVLEGAGPLSKIELSPGDVILNPGDSLYLGAFGYDADNRPLKLKNPSWNTSGEIKTIYGMPEHQHVPDIMQVALFVADTTGQGYIKIQDGAISDSVLVRVFPEVIEEKENNSLAIYPNPAIDNINIELKRLSLLDKVTISIYNIQGQLLLKQSLNKEKTEIDMSGLSKGVYILKLNSINKTKVTKIVKE